MLTDVDVSSVTTDVLLYMVSTDLSKINYVVWKDKFDRTHTIESARELADGTPVRLAGRVTALRWLGKLMFGRIYDINGEIQFSMSREELGAERTRIPSSESSPMTSMQ